MALPNAQRVLVEHGGSIAAPTLLGQGPVSHPHRRQDPGGHQGAHARRPPNIPRPRDLRARRRREPILRADRARDRRGRARAQDAADPEERAVVHGAGTGLSRIRRSPNRSSTPMAKTAATAEAALPLPGRVSGRQLASGDAARARRLGNEREALLERVLARRPGALLHVPRAGADGRHRRRAIRIFGGRKTMLRQDNGGVCDPEPCREYQNRQCNLSGRFIFFIPGINSISAFELHTNSFYAMNAAIQKFETDRLHARRAHLGVPGRAAHVVLHHQEADGGAAHRRGRARGARGALDHRAGGAGRRDRAVARKRGRSKPRSCRRTLASQVLESDRRASPRRVGDRPSRSKRRARPW